MISYVNPDKLTGFYERREQAISDFLENNGQTGAEKEYLLRMEKEVESPFRYGWVDGWSELLASMVADLGSVMALFLAIVLSSLFAGEWYDNTSSLVLTTKNGWGKVASAKILTGLVFTVEFFIILVIPSILSQVFFMGTSGWNMPIQNIKLLAIAPMNMLQAEIYEYMFILLGTLGFAGVVMFISATVKNNVLVLLFSLACVYGPMMIAEYLPYELQKVLDLLPLVGSGADIFRTNTFCIFRKICMVAVSVSYSSYFDRYFLYAFCCKELVKKNEGIALLVLSISLLDAFLTCPLFNQGCCGFKIFVLCSSLESSELFLRFTDSAGKELLLLGK